MTDTTKPNGDRHKGPPEGTASSGSTSPPLDMALLRERADEFGFWPATTDDEHLEKLRADNERFDRMNAHDPQGLKWQKMGAKQRVAEHEVREQ